MADAPAVPESSRGSGVAAGRLSALLAEMAHAPDVEVGGAPSRVPGVGDVLGRFELVREVGRGGFGIVFEAHDRELGRLVALKVVRPGRRTRGLLASEGMRREAGTAAQLDHPGIATLYDVGRWDGGLFLVFELLRGETLEERLRRGPLAPNDALIIACAIAAALGAAHAAGVVHRDLKPANVFLTEDGRVKLLDFGLARLVGGGAAPAGGTPAYMAPEQWLGEDGDSRTDVFAAGVILHRMLTGAVPYPVVDGRPTVADPAARAPRSAAGVPRPLLRVIRAAVAPLPRDRPRDGRALDALLGRAVRELARGPRLRARVLFASSLLALAVAGLPLSGRLLRVEPARTPIALVLADTVNQTGEPALDALSGLLAISLEQSRRVRVVSRARLLEGARLAGRADALRIEGALARRLSADAGAAATLATTVRRAGRRYAVEVDAIAPSTGARLFALEDHAATLDDAPAAIDRLGARVRRELEERDADVERSRVAVGSAVTGSLEAYRHYHAGVDCLERPSRGSARHEKVCEAHFRRALRDDPRFALAHYALATQAGTHGATLEERREALAPALRELDRLPRKERALVLAWDAHLQGDDVRAIAGYEEIAAEYPDDPRVHFLWAELLFHRGAMGEAVEPLERTLALAPEHDHALDHLVTALGLLGSEERLRELAAGWSEGPRPAAVLHALSHARGWLGDGDGAVAAAREALVAGAEAAREDLVRALVLAGALEEAEQELRAMGRSGGLRARHLLAALLLMQGRTRESLAALDAAARAAGDVEQRFLHHAVRAHLLLGFEQSGALRAEGERLRELDRARAAGFAVHLAYAGDLEGAATLAAQLPPGSPARLLVDAVDLWRSGDPLGAVPTLRALVAAGTPDEFPLPPDALRFLLGEVLASAGEHRDALAALREFQGHYAPMGGWRGWALPRSRLLAARALLRLGRDAQAALELEQLLALRARADPGDPLLAEARALLATMEGPGSGERPSRRAREAE